MTNTGNYYMIQIENPKNQDRTWLGWSNSSFGLGFYLTTKSLCKFFSSETLEEDENIKLYLQNKQYKLVPISDIENIKKSSIYY